MYRIEVSPGEETVFRTMEELATGIRNGLVTPRSRIYHQASQKWLPIEFHPHYKKAMRSLDRPRPPTPAPSAGAAAHPPAPTPAPSEPPPPRPAPPARKPAPSIPAAAASLPYIEVEQPDTGGAAPAPMPAPGPLRAHAPADWHAPSHSVQPHGSALPVARRRTAGGRPLVYAGSAVVLVVAGYLTATATPARPAAAAPVPAAVAPAEPEQATPAEDLTEQMPHEDVDVVSEVVAPPTTAPASVIHEVTPRTGPPSLAWSSSAGAIAPAKSEPPPAPAVKPPASAITPPPAMVELAIPALPTGDSLAPSARATRDTAAIKRIMKAVTGSKPSEASVAR